MKSSLYLLELCLIDVFECLPIRMSNENIGPACIFLEDIRDFLAQGIESVRSSYLWCGAVPIVPASPRQWFHIPAGKRNPAGFSKRPAIPQLHEWRTTPHLDLSLQGRPSQFVLVLTRRATTFWSEQQPLASSPLLQCQNQHRPCRSVRCLPSGRF